MNRREAVENIALLLGGTLVGSNVFLSGCKSNTDKPIAFTEADISLLDEIADTILPTTQTPGAKVANTGVFMSVMVNDCYEQKDQKIFYEGIKRLDRLSKLFYNDSFMNISANQRHNLLMKIDHEQEKYMKGKKKDEPSHYFRMMKELTFLGYFTSEIGCSQARRYVEVPGRYDGCISYKKGDKAFA